VRTAPYFAGAMFFGSYSLWRWRNYLRRTLKRKRPISWLILLTIVGLYLVALMPVSWTIAAYSFHMLGMTIVGLSILATVVADSLLSKTQATKGADWWRIMRAVCFWLIVAGGFITLGSIRVVNWFQLAMLGELMMFTGYAIWICIKTYLGDGNRTQLAKILRNIVLVD
jgi:hypothetical protein